MMTITLRDITKDNLDAICDLEVTKNQEQYVSINAYSLAEAAYNEGYIVQAIYQNECPVGFFMWVETNRRKVEIWRFMVDHKYQNQGIGRVALQLAIDKINQTAMVHEIEICYDIHNIIARNFYLSCGFVEIGMDKDQNEMLAIYHCQLD